MVNNIEIPVNKKKIKLQAAGAIVCILLGILFVIQPFLFIKSDDPAVIKIIGYAIVIFFGCSAFLLFKKLNNKTPGIIIDDEGIIDNVSRMAAGKIYWKDIIKLQVELIASQQLLMVYVKNPNDYIQQQKNPVKRQAMDLNMRLYKTPLNIVANNLQIPFQKLIDLIEQKFRENNNRDIEIFRF